MRKAVGFVDQAYFVAVTLEGNFTDEELAVACFKKKGGNLQSYRKRGHELRFEPQLLLYACRRKCTVTNKKASAYTAVPLNDPRVTDSKYRNDFYRLSLELGGEFTDEELALECVKVWGGRTESFRKQGFRLRKWPPFLMLVDRRVCRVTKKSASVYKALPSADVERLRKLSKKEQKIWLRQN